MPPTPAGHARCRLRHHLAAARPRSLRRRPLRHGPGGARARVPVVRAGAPAQALLRRVRQQGLPDGRLAHPAAHRRDAHLRARGHALPALHLRPHPRRPRAARPHRRRVAALGRAVQAGGALDLGAAPCGRQGARVMDRDGRRLGRPLLLLLRHQGAPSR